MSLADESCEDNTLANRQLVGGGNFPTQEIILGDARELARNLEPGSVASMITDPPYGMGHVSGFAATAAAKEVAVEIAGDADLDTALSLFGDVFTAVAPAMAPESDFYVFTKWTLLPQWQEFLVDLAGPFGFDYKMLLVWSKGYPGLGDIEANWGCGHELILYFKRGRRKMPYRRSGVLNIDRIAPSLHTEHPAEKPDGLIEILVEMSTDPGDLVLDPFSGSGSTAVAARNLGRSAIGYELSEPYATASQKRIAQAVLF